jgi:ubiquinone/menaquinone biosynthesis C-methylase UbiE
MVSKNKMQNQEYEAMFNVEESHWWYKGLRGILFPWVTKFKPKKILDAGCGTGINMLYLQNKGYDISGLDPSDLAIEFCKQRGLDKVYKGFIQDLKFKDHEFDVIYCMDVLGILDPKDREKAIQEFNRCLKPGGHLILNSAALQWLFSQHDVACYIQRRFTRKELIELLKNNGFKVNKITYRIFLLFPFVALFKIIEKFTMNKKAEKQEGDLEKTNPIFNLVFNFFMKIENQLLKIINLPIGTSIFFVAEKISN